MKRYLFIYLLLMHLMCVTTASEKEKNNEKSDEKWDEKYMKNDEFFNGGHPWDVGNSDGFAPALSLDLCSVRIHFPEGRSSQRGEFFSYFCMVLPFGADGTIKIRLNVAVLGINVNERDLPLKILKGAYSCMYIRVFLFPFLVFFFWFFFAPSLLIRRPTR